MDHDGQVVAGGLVGEIDTSFKITGAFDDAFMENAEHGGTVALPLHKLRLRSYAGCFTGMVSDIEWWRSTSTKQSSSFAS